MADNLESLFKDARGGSVRAREEIIKHYMNYACAVALGTRSPKRIRDELPSVALLALVQSVDFLIKSDDHPTDDLRCLSIAARIRGAVKDYTAHSAVLKCTWGTFMRDPAMRTAWQTAIVDRSYTNQSPLELEIDEITKKIAQTEIEECVLRLSLKGLTGADIAAALELTRVELCRVRKVIRERYLRLFGEDSACQSFQSRKKKHGQPALAN